MRQFYPVFSLSLLVALGALAGCGVEDPALVPGEATAEAQEPLLSAPPVPDVAACTDCTDTADGSKCCVVTDCPDTSYGVYRGSCTITNGCGKCNNIGCSNNRNCNLVDSDMCECQAPVGGVATCTGTAPAASSCGGGTCTVSGQTVCGAGGNGGGTCYDLTSNASHCGSCNNACVAPTGGSTACVGSACTGSCGSGLTVCGAGGASGGGYCANLTNDANNCNTCGHACVAPTGGSPTCAASMCVGACPSGQSVCGASGATGGGTCDDLQNDANNCGTCGHVCQAPAGGTAKCSAGQCVGACPSAPTACGYGANGGGTCYNEGTDINNCGACGHVCNPPNGGSASCVSGMCAGVCPSGQTACGTNANGNGICSMTSTDVNNCGGCGTVCNTPPDKCHLTQGVTCASGVCDYPTKSCVITDCHSTPTCDTSTGDCVSTPLTGGACGGTGCYVNNATGMCSAGNCVDSQGNPLQMMTCTSNDPCKAGVCSSGSCTTTDVTNGTPCGNNLCVTGNAVCMNGVCNGTPKCTAADDCHSANCDPQTGNCSQSPLPKGTLCAVNSDCKQNAACDATGNCVGNNVPDGTACTLPSGVDCGGAAGMCSAGECGCPGGSGGADMSVPGSTTPPKSGGKHGCSFAPGGDRGAGGILLFLLGLVAAATRRRSRSR